MRQLLAEKLAEEKIVLVKDFADLKQPKTKDVMEFFKAVK